MACRGSVIVRPIVYNLGSGKAEGGGSNPGRERCCSIGEVNCQGLLLRAIKFGRERLILPPIRMSLPKNKQTNKTEFQDLDSGMMRNLVFLLIFRMVLVLG